jgi:hypothetical protein
MDQTTKHTCGQCQGKYTYKNKATHHKTKKHLRSLALPVQIDPVNVQLALFKEQWRNFNIEEKQELMIFFQGAEALQVKTNEDKVVPIEEEEDEDLSKDEKEYAQYLVLRYQDDKTREEVEIYCRHHKRDEEFLSDKDKNSVRSWYGYA